MRIRTLSCALLLAVGFLGTAPAPARNFLVDPLPPPSNPIPDADAAGLKMVSDIVNERIPIDNFTRRWDQLACEGTSFERGEAIAVTGGSSADSPLLGWKVEMIEIGNIYGLAHTANLMTSPHTGNHYLVDNYLGTVDIVRLEKTGSEQTEVGEKSFYQVHSDDTAKASVLWPLMWDLTWQTSPRTQLDPGGGEISRTTGKPKDAQKYYEIIIEGPQGCPVPTPEKELPVIRVASSDPNEIVGPRGAGTGRYLTGDMPLPYIIYFENLETATAAAQDVVITNQLDPAKVDLSTFTLGELDFGDRRIAPPGGLSDWTHDVDLRPGVNLILRIQANLDKISGLATWRFTSLDPVTMQPTNDPVAGFLPPNRTSPEGEGSVSYTVLPKPGLPNATEIRSQARIGFDVNAPIDTNEWLNTIDIAPPTSQVNLAATQTSPGFPVSWSGTDGESGVASYTVYVSENGAVPIVWKQATTQTSGTYYGEPGKSYAFYSIAQDAALNIQANPSQMVSTMVMTPLGDVNLDGKVDVLDVVLVLRSSVQLADLTTAQWIAGDINGDRSINVTDAVAIIRKAVNLSG